MYLSSSLCMLPVSTKCGHVICWRMFPNFVASPRMFRFKVQTLSSDLGDHISILIFSVKLFSSMSSATRTTGQMLVLNGFGFLCRLILVLSELYLVPSSSLMHKCLSSTYGSLLGGMHQMFVFHGCVGLRCRWVGVCANSLPYSSIWL